MTAALKSNHVAELDGLRALLAWWVVAGHYWATFSDRFHDLHNNSAVSVFIILSGFVITSLLRSRPTSYLAFMTGRWFRLFPAYLLLLTVSALTLGAQRSGIGGFWIHTDQNQIRTQILEQTQQHLWPQIAAHVVMLHGLVPTWRVPEIAVGIIGQAWSLSVEWQFYLLAPALIAMIVGRRWILLAICVLALIALNWLPQLRDNSAFMPHQIGWFAVGIGSFFLYEQRAYIAARRLFWFGEAGMLAFGLVQLDLGALVWVTVFPALMVNKGPFALLGRVLKTPVLTALGAASYSTYLVHMLPLFIGMYVMERIGLSTPMASAVLVAGSVLFTLGASMALYRCVEKPGMSLGKRVAQRLPGARRSAPLAVETLTAP